jgi:hypothetical protein
MDQTVRDILTAADRLGEWEFPSDGDGYKTLWADLDAIVPQLETLVGFSLDVDRNVQDASFLTDVGLLDSRYYDRKSGTGAICYVFSFRFSNFSRLFTLHGVEWESRFDELRLGECRELLERHNFTYVPADALDCDYSGVNGPGNPICGSQLTWWIRFFDYI